MALGSEYATPPAAPLWLRRDVLGPTGEILTLADLPPSKPGRWVARRKAEVLAALMGGLLTSRRSAANMISRKRSSCLGCGLTHAEDSAVGKQGRCVCGAPRTCGWSDEDLVEPRRARAPSYPDINKPIRGN